MGGLFKDQDFDRSHTCDQDFPYLDTKLTFIPCLNYESKGSFTGHSMIKLRCYGSEILFNFAKSKHFAIK